MLINYTIIEKKILCQRVNVFGATCLSVRGLSSTILEENLNNLHNLLLTFAT